MRAGLIAFLLLAAPARGQLPPEEIRARWDAMGPEERERVKRSFEQWRGLSADEQELMKRRHERLEIERRRVDDLLPEGDRAALERLRDFERRIELTRRAKEQLRRRFDGLPPELRGRIEGEWNDLPPPERARRAKLLVKQFVEKELVERLRRMVAAGKLERAEVDELLEKARAATDPPARLELIRRFLLDHGDAFALPPEIRDRIRSEPDPAFGLHLFDRFRKGPPPGGLPPPRPHDRRPPADRPPPDRPPFERPPPDRRGGPRGQ